MHSRLHTPLGLLLLLFHGALQAAPTTRLAAVQCKLLLAVVYRSGWLHQGSLGEKVAAQSSQPAFALSFTKSCSFTWKSFTVVALTVSAGSQLYTLTSPRALLRKSSGQLG